MTKEQLINEMWLARTALPFLLTRLGLTHHVVEVGVWKGDFAAHILENAPALENLYLVDTWAHLAEYEDGMNISDEEFARVFYDVQKRFVYEQRAHVLRGESTRTALNFARGAWEFDAVYIDANHSEAACAADLRAWWPLVKSGGIFAGHDYLDTTIGDTVFGVKRAVDAFAKELSLKLYITNEAYPSWLVVKP